MDQERYELENRDERVKEIIRRMPHPAAIDPANINYRLMQDWEVPEWIKTKPEDPNKLIEEFGHGKRLRKQVNYNDELPESQWLKIIEQGGDPSDEVDRIRKRKQGGKTGLKQDDLSIGSDEESGLSKRRKLDIYQDDLPEEDDDDLEESEESFKDGQKRKAKAKPKEEDN